MASPAYQDKTPARARSAANSEGYLLEFGLSELDRHIVAGPEKVNALQIAQ